LNNDRLNRWMTVGSNLAVLVGLIFLIVEIRQNSAIAEAQFYLDMRDTSNAVETAFLGDNLSEVWAKSVIDPGALTPSEIRVMDAFLSSRMGVYVEMLELEKLGYLNPGDTQFRIQQGGPYYFGNKFAQEWWKLTSELDDYGAELSSMMDAAIAEFDASLNEEFIDRLQRRFDDDSEN